MGTTDRVAAAIADRGSSVYPHSQRSNDPFPLTVSDLDDEQGEQGYRNIAEVVGGRRSSYYASGDQPQHEEEEEDGDFVIGDDSEDEDAYVPTSTRPPFYKTTYKTAV